MDRLHVLYNYLVYRRRSVNEHGVHSPFVFDLLLSTIYNKKDFYAYHPLEALRATLLDSEKMVHCRELGAGSVTGDTRQRSVRQLAKTSAKEKKYAQLLFRLADHFQPQTILELGTSLGLSAAHLASANSRSKLITIEGCEELSSIANENIKSLGLQNVEVITGNFDLVLPQTLTGIQQLDLAFFDGNHRKVPTLKYFEYCLEKAHDQSVFIFDDIYWSAEMTQAWNEIKKHPRVTITLDLFQLGIVFFRREQVKQDFIIRY